MSGPHGLARKDWVEECALPSTYASWLMIIGYLFTVHTCYPNSALLSLLGPRYQFDLEKKQPFPGS
jgi:hypothetical protein